MHTHGQDKENHEEQQLQKHMAQCLQHQFVISSVNIFSQKISDYHLLLTLSSHVHFAAAALAGLECMYGDSPPIDAAYASA